MRIGIDIRNIGKKRTGDEVVFFNLTKNLAQIDSQNEYRLFTDIIDPEIIKNIRQCLGIENKTNFQIVSLGSVVTGPLRRSGPVTTNRFTWNLWTLPKYLRQNPVDIYLTQYITPFFIPKEIKIATIVHDVSFKVYRQYIKKSDLFFLDLLIPLSFKRADKIIAVSKFTREEILKYYQVNDKKVDWIQNAVSDNFRETISPAQLKQVKDKYNLPEKFILYIGTLQPRKNIPALVEAYAGLPDAARSEFKLVLAGGKAHNYDSHIDESIKKNSLQNSVILPGFVAEDDKPAIFKLSHLFCNVSFYEGFGITILEAMTLGIPSIASDIPPHREAAENSIIYCNPKNTLELTEKLNSVLMSKDSQNDLIQKELLQAQNFSWKKSAKKILKIIENIA
jgi:glycosyltransferase involved in cell wall biosynthesis